MMLWSLLAQAAPVVQVQPVDPLGGWFAVLLQGGAFGLLTYIVAVLGPRYFRDAREERDKRDSNFIAMAEILQTKFAERNAILAQHIEKQTAYLTNSLEKQTADLGNSLARAADRIEHAVQIASKDSPRQA